MSDLIVFGFENQKVRCVGTPDQPEWIAQDVCDVLSVGLASNTLRNFDFDEKGMYSIHTPGGEQEMLTVTEPGLYRLIFKSRKAVAKRFQRWIFHEVLPSLRRTGSYSIQQNQQSPKALIVARAINEINELVVDISPRLAQYLIDHTISEVLEQTALPGTTEILRGVVEIAEEMGLPVNAQNRSQLGRFVKNSPIGQLAVPEKRLVNGTMREVQCYPDTEAVRNIIRSFFS
ncbi:BRO-N domain-containing protein [Gloeothece verrucosa]|uniref:Prophage antirepressor n=1 Tax=Gloeothece verrucosa (strain PCC 7822) TaxID=497965 RepID=E0UCD4_GLOV7|nr:BRO family protein [Gloeothece verrucosa]ADN12891.1 prophage antirepressor [Gloeothece verrucosa PCC 7822]